MFKKIIIGVLLAGSICGCKTVFPPTEDDGNVVSPETISNEKSKDGDPVLPPMTPWWHYTK